MIGLSFTSGLGLARPLLHMILLLSLIYVAHPLDSVEPAVTLVIKAYSLISHAYASLI